MPAIRRHIPLDEIRLVIFDLDGTLIDSSKDIAVSVNFALAEVGLPERTIDEIRNAIGYGARALIRNVLGDRNDLFEAAFSALARHYGENLLVHTTVYPGVSGVLDHLKSRTLAVLSNKRQRFCDPIIDGLNLRDRFSYVMGGDALPRGKPHPDPILHLCERTGVSPKQTVMVGDSAIDVEAGRAAGSYTIGLTKGFTSAEEVTNSNPDMVFDHLIEFEKHLAGL